MVRGYGRGMDGNWWEGWDWERGLLGTRGITWIPLSLLVGRCEERRRVCVRLTKCKNGAIAVICVILFDGISPAKGRNARTSLFFFFFFYCYSRFLSLSCNHFTQVTLKIWSIYLTLSEHVGR